MYVYSHQFSAELSFGYSLLFFIRNRSPRRVIYMVLYKFLRSLKQPCKHRDVT